MRARRWPPATWRWCAWARPAGRTRASTCRTWRACANRSARRFASGRRRTSCASAARWFPAAPTKSCARRSKRDSEARCPSAFAWPSTPSSCARERRCATFSNRPRPWWAPTIAKRPKPSSRSTRASRRRASSRRFAWRRWSSTSTTSSTRSRSPSPTKSEPSVARWAWTATRSWTFSRRIESSTSRRRTCARVLRSAARACPRTCARSSTADARSTSTCRCWAPCCPATRCRFAAPST